MATPYLGLCWEKLRLTVLLADAHRRIIDMHDLAITALNDGDFQTDAILCGELEVERVMIGMARDELQVHIIAHQC